MHPAHRRLAVIYTSRYSTGYVVVAGWDVKCSILALPIEAAAPVCVRARVECTENPDGELRLAMRRVVGIGHMQGLQQGRYQHVYAHAAAGKHTRMKCERAVNLCASRRRQYWDTQAGTQGARHSKS